MNDKLYLKKLKSEYEYLKVEVEYQAELFEKAKSEFEKIRAKESKVLQGITEKYGPGSLDPKTGVFTPSKS